MLGGALAFKGLVCPAFVLEESGSEIILIISELGRQGVTSIRKHLAMAVALFSPLANLHRLFEIQRLVSGIHNGMLPSVGACRPKGRRAWRQGSFTHSRSGVQAPTKPQLSRSSSCERCETCKGLMILGLEDVCQSL